MEIIKTEFSKELLRVLQKYKKTLTADKSGIHVIDCDDLRLVGVQKATTPSEEYRDTLVFVI